MASSRMSVMAITGFLFLLITTTNVKASGRNEYVDGNFYRTGRHLPSIPDDIPAEATTVRLQYNDITLIPANVFSHLTNCTLIDLAVNEISNIEPNAFAGLESLQVVNLQINSLSNLEADMFLGLQSLQKLWLSTNAISDLKPGVFAHLGGLQELGLYSNRIKHLKQESFTGLDSIKKLQLADNQIESIELNTFVGLLLVTELHLDQNRLTSLDPRIVASIPRPFTMTLSANPLQCYPEMCWLKIERSRSTILYHGVTEKPYCADGIDWDTMNCDPSITTLFPPLPGPTTITTTGDDSTTTTTTTTTAKEETATTKTTNGKTQTTTRTTTATTDTDIAESKTNDDTFNEFLPWILGAVIVVVALICGTVLLVVLIRRGIICSKTPDRTEHTSQPSGNTGTHPVLDQGHRNPVVSGISRVNGVQSYSDDGFLEEEIPTSIYPLGSAARTEYQGMDSTQTRESREYEYPLQVLN